MRRVLLRVGRNKVPLVMTDPVLIRAKEIVTKSRPRYGYGDVGDLLVSYLREDIGCDSALQKLNWLEQDYQKGRR